MHARPQVAVILLLYLRFEYVPRYFMHLWGKILHVFVRLTHAVGTNSDTLLDPWIDIDIYDHDHEKTANYYNLGASLQRVPTINCHSWS